MAALAAPLSLEALPSEILAQVVALTGSPEALLAVAAGCRALRASLHAPRHVPLWRLWGALVLRAADPAASLALLDRRGGAAAPAPAPPLSDAQVAMSRVEHMYENKEARTMDPYIPTLQYQGPGVPPASYKAGELDLSFFDEGDDDDESEESDADKPDEAAMAAMCKVMAGFVAHVRAVRLYTGETPAWAMALAQHAIALGSWSALVRALTRRECIACGAVTRWVAWAPADDAAARIGPGRCCAGCTLPGAATVARCMLLNAAFFSADESRAANAELDAAAFGSDARAATAALQAAVDACPEGGTVKLRGTWELSGHLAFQGRNAMRLLGVPPPAVLADAAAYVPAHPLLAPDEQDDSPREASCGQLEVPRQVLVDAEAEAAADARVGCPAARLVFGEDLPPLVVGAPLWLEGLCVCTGNRETYGKYGWPHEVNDDIFGYGISVRDGVCVRRMRAGAGVDPALAPLVLTRSWITAYNGSGLVLDVGAHAALLGCCISNCMGAAVACNAGATLRMRHSHIVANNADVSGGRWKDAAALADANVFVENWPVPGTIDVFPFPPGRSRFALPNETLITPATELVPWNPMFTVEVSSPEGNERQRSGTFPNLDDVALLTM